MIKHVYEVRKYILNPDGDFEEHIAVFPSVTEAIHCMKYLEDEDSKNFKYIPYDATKIFEDENVEWHYEINAQNAFVTYSEWREQYV